MQSSNLTPQLSALGVTSGDAVKRLWDSSITLGGPLKRDDCGSSAPSRRRKPELVANAFMPMAARGFSIRRSQLTAR
jgi:hypothetical protein